jgi:hypothetical protein
MTDDEIRAVVKATLTELGLDVTSPARVIQAQHDFACGTNATFRRNLRSACG